MMADTFPNMLAYMRANRDDRMNTQIQQSEDKYFSGSI